MSWPKTRPEWIDRALTCAACGKTTYRPLASQRPCEWCGGVLWEPPTPVEQRETQEALFRLMRGAVEETGRSAALRRAAETAADLAVARRRRQMRAVT